VCPRGRYGATRVGLDDAGTAAGRTNKALLWCTAVRAAESRSLAILAAVAYRAQCALRHWKAIAPMDVRRVFDEACRDLHSEGSEETDEDGWLRLANRLKRARPSATTDQRRGG